MLKGLIVIRFIFILILVTTVSEIYSQIQLDTTHTERYLVESVLLGNGVKVGNIQFTGVKHAIGVFEDSNKTIGIGKGIILTSGNAYYSIGPNQSANKSWASGAPGDEDLNKYTTGFTYDAAVLEFDFITEAENLVFNYVFASEEYLEYVGSKFNDVFGFFVSGPGIQKINIARLPDTGIPITINNVNHQSNSEYYINNAFEDPINEFIYDPRKKKLVRNKEFKKNHELPSYDIQFDGFTSVLQAKLKVIPNEVYHIKIAIADVADGILDSGVFLEAESFRSFGEEIIIIDKQILKYEDPLLATIPKLNLRYKQETKLQPVVPIEVIRLTKKESETKKVHFKFDSYVLADTSTIWQVYKILKENPDASVEINGHTDHIGSDEYNLKLSQKRSISALNYLKSRGITMRKIKAQYFGESSPIEANETKIGRARNRRVELVIKYSSEGSTN